LAHYIFNPRNFLRAATHLIASKYKVKARVGAVGSFSFPIFRFDCARAARTAKGGNVCKIP
jgi:hypothetical protein